MTTTNTEKTPETKTTRTRTELDQEYSALCMRYGDLKNKQNHIAKELPRMEAHMELLIAESSKLPPVQEVPPTSA